MSPLNGYDLEGKTKKGINYIAQENNENNENFCVTHRQFEGLEGKKLKNRRDM